MISTGNDIVALDSQDINKAAGARFYSKILHADEVGLFDKVYPLTPSFGHFVWLLWSIKEAVYKFQQRHDATLLFSPAKIIVQDIIIAGNCMIKNFGKGQLEHVLHNQDNGWNCMITTGGKIFYSSSRIFTECIHTVATSQPDLNNIGTGIKYIEQQDYLNQSHLVRSFLQERIQSVFPDKQILIAKSPLGYPYLLHKNKEIPIPVSFSHHGHFISYSFDCNQCPVLQICLQGS